MTPRVSKLITKQEDVDFLLNLKEEGRNPYESLQVFYQILK